MVEYLTKETFKEKVFDFECEISSEQALEFEDDVGYGETKDDAMIDLAQKRKLKLWNES